MKKQFDDWFWQSFERKLRVQTDQTEEPTTLWKMIVYPLADKLIGTHDTMEMIANELVGTINE